MTSGLWHFPGHGRAGVGAVEGGMGRGGWVVIQDLRGYTSP